MTGRGGNDWAYQERLILLGQEVHAPTYESTPGIPMAQLNGRAGILIHREQSSSCIEQSNFLPMIINENGTTLVFTIQNGIMQA